jgi:flap endonuclease-1
MGINLRELVIAHEIGLDALSGKVLVFDSHNLLYQFLSTIRQPDGTPLMDRKGRVTSHLNGLFSRTAHLLEKGIKPVFVFDGTPPALKHQEISRRREAKHQAEVLYEVAKASENLAEMKKYASRTTRLTGQMVAEAKDLIRLLGCPVVQAPSEGEAQAVHVMKRESAYAVVSQDFDSLIYGADRLVRNLSIAGRRRQRHGFVDVKPEMIQLAETLDAIALNSDQLLSVALLVGTDYNPGGVKGLGPKKALALVKKHGSDFKTMFKEAGWSGETSWEEIWQLFRSMPVNDDYSLSWQRPDTSGINRFLCEEHDFSPDRVDPLLRLLIPKQRGLSDFFK